MTIACSKFKLYHFYCAQPKWSVLLVCTISPVAKCKTIIGNKTKRYCLNSLGIWLPWQLLSSAEEESRSRRHELSTVSRNYRKTPLISTYVFSGLATEQVLIFGAVLTFGVGAGYDKAEAKILQGRSLFNPVLSAHKTLLCMFQRLCTGYRGDYIRGVCTFGALQPTANFSKNWRCTYFRRGTYLLINGVLLYYKLHESFPDCSVRVTGTLWDNLTPSAHTRFKRQCHDKSVVFGSQFVRGKNGGHKATPRKTTIAPGKRRLLGSAGAVKLFARQTELMSATLARAVAIFCSRKKALNITEYRDTAPLRHHYRAKT